MKKNFFVALFLVVFSVLTVFGATNYVQDGDALSLTWSGTAPTAGDPVIKCGTAIASGAVTGVALTTGTTTTNTTVATKGVFTLPVRAISTPIAVGDFIYTTTAGANSCVASLTNTNTGYIFGKSLESLATASLTQNIKVLLIQR